MSIIAVLNPGDIDAELERLDLVHHMPVIREHPSSPEGNREAEQGEPRAPRPLSPTRLQPVVAPEAQSQEIPDLEVLLRLRAEIPRALKRRGSVDHSQPLKKASHYQPNQYKHLINKLFHRKDRRQKGEQGSETSSSSEGEESAMPPARLPQTSTMIPHDFRVRAFDDVLILSNHDDKLKKLLNRLNKVNFVLNNRWTIISAFNFIQLYSSFASRFPLQSYHSILRQSKQKSSGRRARLSPLVLLLDGSLVGELETVQRAVQEVCVRTYT